MIKRNMLSIVIVALVLCIILAFVLVRAGLYEKFNMLLAGKTW